VKTLQGKLAPLLRNAREIFDRASVCHILHKCVPNNPTNDTRQSPAVQRSGQGLVRKMVGEARRADMKLWREFDVLLWRALSVRHVDLSNLRAWSSLLNPADAIVLDPEVTFAAFMKP
jgi:hypothetical protein